MVTVSFVCKGKVFNMIKGKVLNISALPIAFLTFAEVNVGVPSIWRKPTWIQEDEFSYMTKLYDKPRPQEVPPQLSYMK